MSNAQPVLPRIAAGDHTAVDECLQRYGGLVWSLARRRCADIQLVEDAVQNIFMHLWKVAATFDESIASETTFIAMIARRRLIDYQRKQMSRKDFAQCELDHLETPTNDPTTRIEICEEAARAEKLLQQLPADQQAVIRLNVFEGLSHSKIADQTGLKLGTVKTYIRRGLTKIRESLFREESISGELPNAKIAFAETTLTETTVTETASDSEIYAREPKKHLPTVRKFGSLPSN